MACSKLCSGKGCPNKKFKDFEALMAKSVGADDGASGKDSASDSK